MMQCSDLDAVMDLRDGDLTVDSRELAEHLRGCVVCGTRHPEILALYEDARDIPVPAFRRPSRWPRRLLVLAAASLLLIVVGRWSRPRTVVPPRQTEERRVQTVGRRADVERAVRVRTVMELDRRLTVTETSEWVRAPLPGILSRTGTWKEKE